MINSAGMGGAVGQITDRIPREDTPPYRVLAPRIAMDYDAVPPYRPPTSPFDISGVKIATTNLWTFPDTQDASDGQFSYFPEVSGVDETSLGAAAMRNIVSAAERQIQDAKAKLWKMHRYLRDPDNNPKPDPEKPEVIVTLFNLATLDDVSVLSHIPPK